MMNLNNLTKTTCFLLLQWSSVAWAQVLSSVPPPLIGNTYRISALEGDMLSFPKPKIEGENYQYTWYRVDEEGDSTTVSDELNLEFESLTLNDAGEYFVSIQSIGNPDRVFKSRPYFLQVDPLHLSHEAARDASGKLRFIVHLSDLASQVTRRNVFDKLLEMGARPVPGEVCLCEGEFSLWQMPGQFEINNEIIIGATSLINSACEEVEAVGGPFVGMGYDYGYLGSDTPQEMFNANGLGITTIPGISSDPSEEEPIKVAVIDLGIDKNHQALSPFIQPMENYVTCIDANMGYNFVNGDSNPFEVESSHGTHVAGILSGFIPNKPLQIMSLQVGKTGADTRVFDLVCAIKYAMEQQVDLINLSMGYQGPESELLRNVIEELAASPSKIQLVAGSGNNGQNLGEFPFWPAAYAEVFPNHIISVAAMNSDYSKLADFSNFGQNRITIAAPGEQINSTINGFDNYGVMSGTSMATPFVSATLAYLKAEYPGKEASFYMNELLNNPIFSRQEASLQNLVKEKRVLNVELMSVGINVGKDIERNSLLISPNPSIEEAIISFPNPGNQVFDMSFYGLDGRLLREVSGLQGDHYQLRKEELKPGLYMIVVKLKNGIRMTGKIIFQ